MTRTAGVVIVALLTTSGGTMLAQTAPAPPPPIVFQDTVVVTAERGETRQSWIPAATVVLDAAALAELPALSLGEVLAFIPGFRVQQAGLYSGRPVVSARGFFGGGEAEYVTLLVDGVRVGDAESGLIDWATVNGTATARIEASRGPGASLYGDAAVGGVIQVLTDSKTTHDTLSVSGGSLGSATFDGTWRWRRNELVGFLASAIRRTNGFSAHADATEFTVGHGINGTLGALAWRWTTHGQARTQDESGAVSQADRARGVTHDPLFRFDDRDRRGLLTAFAVRSSGTTWTQQARLSVNARAEDGVRTILLAPQLGDSRHRELSSSGVTGSAEFERSLGVVPNSVLRVGVDLERQHLDTYYTGVRDGVSTGTIAGRAKGHRVRTGAFASTSWMPATPVRLFGALRWDRIADSDFGRSRAPDAAEAWSPRLGIVIQPAALGGASIFGQVSRAFKAPTLDQKFDPRPYPDFRGGTFTISNATLIPQSAANVEAGVSGGRTVRWSALAYRMNVENEIDFDARTFSYANIGQSRHVGVEAEVQVASTARIRPRASYALSDVTATDTEPRRQLKNVPRHRLMLGAAASLPWQLDLFASLGRTWDTFLDDDNAVPVRAGTMVDLRVRRSIGNAMAFVDVVNALDRRHDEFGFTLADFRGGVVPYVYPGHPRVVRVGLTVGGK